MTLWQAIMVAYGPVDCFKWGCTEVLNAPQWIGEPYDINARVSQADVKPGRVAVSSRFMNSPRRAKSLK